MLHYPLKGADAYGNVHQFDFIAHGAVLAGGVAPVTVAEMAPEAAEAAE